ncbi:MAG: cytochrome P450 [Chloroflexaceae bacterium]|jgi:cytochrome P450 PksS|nr:cytochrome P450 [Chloroflexaceae bacterium]
MTTEINLFSHEVTQNPYPAFAHLRREAPMFRTQNANGHPLWLVTRYDDVVAILKDQRFVKSWRNALTPEELARVPVIPEYVNLLNQHMLATDPPDHTRLRGLVQKAFTPRLVEGLRPRIQQIADELLDAVEGKGEMDLLDAYAFPLPITVIGELLGIPAEDREQFRAWSSVVVSFEPSTERFQQMGAALREFTNYLGKLFALRQAEPQDDLVSALIQAEEAGDRLSQSELFSMVFLLLVAGHETTVNLIGNGVLALLQHPAQMELLKQRPELIQSAVEEFLRYDSPVETSTPRFAREDIPFGDVLIKRGDEVLVVIGSADRDEARFANPDELDITRSDNRHVAFGHGIHFCLGAPLARLEGEIAIGTLLRRLPNLRLAVPADELLWRPGLLIRGLQRFPVKL